MFSNVYASHINMVGFPKVPQIRGDTDDDASIHLYSHVGPAKPIRNRNYDQQIMDILNRKPHGDTEGETDLENEELNNRFQKYAYKQSNFAYNSEEEDTQVEEEEEDHPLPPKKKSRSSSTHTTGTQSLISIYDPKFLGFIIGALVVFFAWPFLPRNVVHASVDLAGVNSHIARVEQRVLAINDITAALTEQIDIAQSKQEAFMALYSQTIASLESQLSAVQNASSASSQRFDNIQEEIQTYKQKIDSMELVKENPQELQTRLEEISSRLGQLSKLNTDIDSFKDSIVNSLVEKLPEHVPIFFKDRKIHYLPEFQKFLYSFIEKHNSGSKVNLSWNEFLEENDSSLKSYVENVLKHPNVKFVTKDHFEKSLNDFFARENAKLDSKLSKIIDAADLTGNLTDFETLKKANDVMLESLVETVTKRSIKINYAEYGLGSRILGYLTSTGLDSYKTKSFARKLFLGWYDYLSSNGLRSGDKLKFNANNILVDNGYYWKCENAGCSVGIRLLAPIIFTDLVLKNPLSSRPTSLTPPSKISVFVKPRKKQQVAGLQEYLRTFRPEFLSALGSNKYLSKFFKIQEVELPTGSSVEHIRLPVSIINLKVLVRDLYLQIESVEGTTGLCNVKVYGIEEYFSLKYADEFESILGEIHQQETTRPAYYLSGYDSSRILGEDDYVYM